MTVRTVLKVPFEKAALPCPTDFLAPLGLRCYGTCTVASCADLFLKYFKLAFFYDRVVSHSKFVLKD